MFWFRRWPRNRRFGHYWRRLCGLWRWARRLENRRRVFGNFRFWMRWHWMRGMFGPVNHRVGHHRAMADNYRLGGMLWFMRAVKIVYLLGLIRIHRYSPLCYVASGG